MADLGQIIANAIQASLTQFQLEATGNTFVPSNPSNSSTSNATLVPDSHPTPPSATPQPGTYAPPNSPDSRGAPVAPPPIPPITPYQSVRVPPPSASSMGHPSLVSLMASPSATTFGGMASLGIPLPPARSSNQVSRSQVNAARRDSAARHSSTPNSALSRRRRGKAVPPPGLERSQGPQIMDAFQVSSDGQAFETCNIVVQVIPPRAPADYRSQTDLQRKVSFHSSYTTF